MNYYSLHRQSPSADFREATIRGQAPDKGLYFPEYIPPVTPAFISSLKDMSPAAIGFSVMKPYVQPVIPDDVLETIVEETLSFDIPLVRITENIHSLELFHGPTLAFKDVGARFMSRCLGYFSKGEKQRIIVLVATSGDTGGAVADGFYGVDGVEVVILYPSGKVSPVQELQLTTYGGNIHALEVEGDFDACQRMVKQAFADPELQSSMFLTSANSINVARWLPQQIYYFLALRQWHDGPPPVISVPSGNFGNICAGMLAARSGLPVDHFIAACNANDVVPSYLRTGTYAPMRALATLSNAMDVGDPSNFVRVLELFRDSFPALSEKLSSYSISDLETKETIATIWRQHKYMLDPHGAVGYASLEKYLTAHPGKKGLFLETAHPVKFPGSVEELTGERIRYPHQVEALQHKNKNSLPLRPDFGDLQKYLHTGFK